MDTQDLIDFFSEFKCVKEADAQDFIRHRAVEYEQDNRSQTVLYLAGDETAMERLSIDRGLDGFSLAGYFAISDAPTDSEIDTAGVLIAQLARDDRWDGSHNGKRHNPLLDGGILLCDAEKVAVERATHTLPYPGWQPTSVPLYLDCKKKLRGYYESYGYEYLYYDKPIHRIKMFKRVSML